MAQITLCGNANPAHVAFVPGRLMGGGQLRPRLRRVAERARGQERHPFVHSGVTRQPLVDQPFELDLAIDPVERHEQVLAHFDVPQIESDARRAEAALPQDELPVHAGAAHPNRGMRFAAGDLAPARQEDRIADLHVHQLQPRLEPRAPAHQHPADP